MQLEVIYLPRFHCCCADTLVWDVQVVMPRVRKDGACAQFRPSQPEESMIQLYKVARSTERPRNASPPLILRMERVQAGRTEHMIILRGNANVAPGGMVELAQANRLHQHT